jgi:hypothetical protein
MRKKTRLKEKFSVQASSANPGALPIAACLKLFVFNAIWNRRGVPNSDCDRFRSCQSLTLQQLSSTRKNFANIVSSVFTPQNDKNWRISDAIPFWII